MRGALFAAGVMALALVALFFAARARLGDFGPPENARLKEIAGLRVQVIDEGPYPALRTVALVHGSGGSVDDWTRLRRALRSRYRVVAMDRPGNGWSDPLPSGERDVLAWNARFVRAVLDHLGVERPVLLGWSYGGAIALRMAADDPRYAAGIVHVCGIAPGWDLAETDLAGVARLGVLLGTPLLGRVLDAAILPNAIAWTPRRLWLEAQYGPDWEVLPEPILERTLLGMQKPKRIRFREGVRLEEDLAALEAELGEIRIPVVVVNGGLDGTVPTDVGRRLARTLPNARHVELAGGRHTLPVRRPEWLARQVSELMESLPPILQRPPQRQL